MVATVCELNGCRRWRLNDDECESMDDEKATCAGVGARWAPRKTRRVASSDHLKSKMTRRLHEGSRGSGQSSAFQSASAGGWFDGPFINDYDMSETCQMLTPFQYRLWYVVIVTLSAEAATERLLDMVDSVSNDVRYGGRES
jgi:hypothetical protein